MLLMLTAALSFCFSASLAQGPPRDIAPIIHVEGDTWGAPPADIGKVLDSAASQIFPYFHDRAMKPILVSRGNIVPITLDQRGPDGEFQVKLTAHSTFWAQYTYQFAHELCHVLASVDHPHRGRHQWFEESLCETSSLFVLSKMHEAWDRDPPYPNWKSWGVHYDEYLNAMLAERARRLAADQTMSQWVTSKLPELEKERKVTEHSKLAAAYLLGIFQDEPQGWEAITWLNTSDDNDESLAFEDHLRAWRRRVPERHKAFLGKIQKLFGYPVG
ncbi:MAG TPA: hypothetical protein VG326_00085 [Tepidisphaeraceae bacterium]|jgi:hypothetical protein|nr:hypothetical protein [Tepidisphaeraceae bacterium]